MCGLENYFLFICRIIYSTGMGVATAGGTGDQQVWSWLSQSCPCLVLMLPGDSGVSVRAPAWESTQGMG